MAVKNIKRSLNMSEEMHGLLMQLTAKRGRDVTESDLIREAIREYLDAQSDLVGSKRHFGKSLQARLDRLESILTFQANVQIYLLSALFESDAEEALAEAIITAKRDGEALLAQIRAVRDLEPPT